MNRAVQLPGRCWEVAESDEYHPHFDTQQSAQARAADRDEETPALQITLLQTPCWEACCPTCGERLENGDYGVAHYANAFDAEQDEDVFCDQGCELPGPDPLAPSTEGMEPLPGMGEAS